MHQLKLSRGGGVGQALTMKAYGVGWHDLPKSVCRTLQQQSDDMNKHISRGSKLGSRSTTMMVSAVLPGDVSNFETREDVGIAELYAAELIQVSRSPSQRFVCCDEPRPDNPPNTSVVRTGGCAYTAKVRPLSIVSRAIFCRSVPSSPIRGSLYQKC